MTGSKLVKKMLKMEHKSQGEAAEIFGIARQSFCNKVARDTWSFEDVEKLADALGYEITIRKKANLSE